jgi:hypothetical protein
MASLGVEALDRAALVYGWIAKIDFWLTSGSPEDEAKARAIIGQLAHVTAGEIPVVRGIISAELKAAEAFDLTERTLARFFPRVTQPHPDAANDHLGTSDQSHPDFA